MYKGRIESTHDVITQNYKLSVSEDRLKVLNHYLFCCMSIYNQLVINQYKRYDTYKNDEYANKNTKAKLVDNTVLNRLAQNFRDEDKRIKDIPLSFVKGVVDIVCKRFINYFSKKGDKPCTIELYSGYVPMYVTNNNSDNIGIKNKKIIYISTKGKTKDTRSLAYLELEVSTEIEDVPNGYKLYQVFFNPNSKDKWFVKLLYRREKMHYIENRGRCIALVLDPFDVVLFDQHGNKYEIINKYWNYIPKVKELLEYKKSRFYTKQHDEKEFEIVESIKKSIQLTVKKIAQNYDYVFVSDCPYIKGFSDKNPAIVYFITLILDILYKELQDRFDFVSKDKDRGVKFTSNGININTCGICGTTSDKNIPQICFGYDDINFSCQKCGNPLNKYINAAMLIYKNGFSQYDIEITKYKNK